MSICQSRYGRSNTPARTATPTIRRRTIAACRRRSARCLSTGSAEAPCLLYSTLLLCRWLRALALDAADGLIERRQERRSVARRERSGTAGHIAGRTQIGHQIANRQRHPDRLFGKRLAVRRDHLGARFDAAARERDIGGNDDIALSGAFRNPVVGGIHPGTRRDA